MLLLSAGLRLWGPWFTQKNEAPKIQLGVWGSAVSSPSGVREAEIEFLSIMALKYETWWQQFQLFS